MDTLNNAMVCNGREQSIEGIIIADVSKRARLEKIILPLLRCIKCEAETLALNGSDLSCGKCRARYPIHNDVPLLVTDSKAALDFDHTVVVEHHYSEQWQELIRRAGDGLILDLGSGNNPGEGVNLIKLDIFPLPNVDIVGVAENLPFRDERFRAVISGAVFEHVQDPFVSIQEVYRIVEPDGDVYIETAFLQPVHAFPSHYFNMTRMGVDHLCRHFTRIASGVQRHQYPSFALGWFLSVMARKLPYMARQEFMRARVKDIVEEYESDPYSNRWMEHLNEGDIEELACGVYFYGRKTSDALSGVEPLPELSPPPRRNRFRRVWDGVKSGMRRRLKGVGK